MRYKHLFFFLVIIVFVGKCVFFSKKETDKSKNAVKNIPQKNILYDTKTISTIVHAARTYIGTPYRSGGVSAEKGLDCSGFVDLAFRSANLKLPRASNDIAAVGTEIPVEDICAGDLVFFITGKSNRINHVGIVTERRSWDTIQFIHSASKGVREDNLFSKYYQSRFTKAMRPF